MNGELRIKYYLVTIVTILDWWFITKQCIQDCQNVESIELIWFCAFYIKNYEEAYSIVAKTNRKVANKTETEIYIGFSLQ